MPKRKNTTPRLEVPKADAQWFGDRAKEMGTTLSKLSLDILGHKDLLGRTLKGERGFKPNEIVAMSVALRTPVAAIFRRLGYDVPGATCQLVGTINAQSRVSILPPQNQTAVSCPSELDTDLIALRVDAPNSVLAIYHGTIFFYAPAKKMRPDAIGRLSVIELGDHPAPVVGVLDRAAVGTGRVILFGSQDAVESDEVISASPIRWQRAG